MNILQGMSLVSTIQRASLVFTICRKYMPERARLRDNLFTKASIGSEIGIQCLQDMVNICVSDERVAYYPCELPIDGRCPVCSREMSRFVQTS
jgi:hypothetical protein